MTTLASLFFMGSSSFLQVTTTTGFEIRQDLTRDYGERFVATLVTSLLQITRTTIKACISLNLGQIPLPTTELAVIERLKINV